MTYETYEKAVDLRDQMDNISELQSLFANSISILGNNYLAAIDVLSTNHSESVVETCKVLNHMRVPDNVMKKINEILDDEYERLQNEFNEL